MPKEIIKDDSPMVDEDVHVQTEVSWGRNQAYIQLGVVRSDRPDSTNPDDGWYATFDDRADVNRLIRILRKARDQAFGADA